MEELSWCKLEKSSNRNDWIELPLFNHYEDHQPTHRHQITSTAKLPSHSCTENFSLLAFLPAIPNIFFSFPVLLSFLSFIPYQNQLLKFLKEKGKFLVSFICTFVFENCCLIFLTDWCIYVNKN